MLSQPIYRIAEGLAVLSYFAAVVVFPTCLLIVVPALRYLPATSRLWQPLYACLLASVVAVFAIWAWVIAVRGRFFIPEHYDHVHVGFGLAAVFAGVTFAYTYSVRLRRSSHAAESK